MASYIPEDKISEIRNTVNIVDVISDIVLLKKAGKNFVGLCPFHSEKTPSFTVSPEKQIFYCFGCGAGGNVFSFLMKHEGVSFPESVRMLAGRYGIDIPTRDMTPDQKRRISEKETLLAINEEAAAYFHWMLCESAGGKPAMRYLLERGITEETCRHYHLGFAPDRWDTIVDFFSNKKRPLSLVEKSGLIVPRKQNAGFYDRFRKRIVFPIFNVNGKVIGFGGRVLDDALPKYLNSPDSPVFNKSRSLYGLQAAKSSCRETGAVYIVEGYFDLLALHQCGITNAVATLGTAFTTDHLRVLKGYAQRVNLVYDSDQAGIKSAERCIGMFLEENIDARIVILPAGYDPDSYLFEFGKDAFLKIADDALGVITFLINSAINAHGLTIEGRTRIVAELKTPLSSIDDPVARSLCLKEISERIGVSETAMLESIRDASPTDATVPSRMGRTDRTAFGGLTPDDTPETASGGIEFEKDNRLERHIITMMIQFPAMLSDVKNRRILDRFESTDLRAIGQVILAHCLNTQRDVSDILAHVDNNRHRKVLTQLAIQEHVWDRQGCLRLLSQYEHSRDRRENSLVEKIQAAERNHDDALLLELLQKKQDLISKRH